MFDTVQRNPLLKPSKYHRYISSISSKTRSRAHSQQLPHLELRFLLYSDGEQSWWLIDIAHGVYDPALNRGLLPVSDAAGQMWRNINPTDRLITSTWM